MAIPKYILEQFAGGLSQSAFVELVSDVTNYKWSRPSLSYMIEYGVVTEYEEVTKKANAERPRLIFGTPAFYQVLIFLLMRESMQFISRGTNQNEKDPSQKSEKKNDVLKYKLVSYAVKACNDNRGIPDIPISEYAEKLSTRMSDLRADYIKSHNGEIDEREWQEIMQQMIKVFLAYAFFYKLLYDFYLEESRDLDADWDYMVQNVLDKRPLVKEVPDFLGVDEFTIGCHLLLFDNFMNGLDAYCSIIVSSKDPRRHRYTTYDYTNKEKNQLVALTQIACRFDTDLMAEICFSYVHKMRLEGFEGFPPSLFGTLCRLVMLTSSLVSTNDTRKGQKKF